MRNAHVTNVSERDLEGFNVSGRGTYVSFQWHQVRITSVDPAKNGQTERRLALVRQPIGDTATISTRYITEDQAKKVFPAEWEYFTRNGDMPLNGTAIGELPGVSNSQVQIMLLSGLRSIEDIASVPEEVTNAIGFEGRVVRKLAEEWLRRKNDGAGVINYAERQASTEAAVKSANDRAARAEQTAANLQAQIDAMQRMMGGQAAGAAAMGVGMGATGGDLMPVMPGGGSYQEGPDIDSMPNPLAEGPGDMDFLNDDNE